jgi:hypothetical protein
MGIDACKIQQWWNVWCNNESFIVLILTYMGHQQLFCQSQLFNLFEQFNLKLNENSNTIYFSLKVGHRTDMHIFFFHTITIFSPLLKNTLPTHLSYSLDELPPKNLFLGMSQFVWLIIPKNWNYGDSPN